MPVWLLSALTLLRSLATRGAAAIGGRRGVAATGTALALPDPFNIFGGGRDDDRPRRRRRRRALTNSDRDDIAFIAATISKTAAAAFSVQLVTRSR